jgi:hypothetical protein
VTACPTLTYDGITVSTWLAIKARIVDEGYAVTPAASGTASADGFTISWAYDAPSGTLRITCEDSPWLVSCDMINGEIDRLVKSVPRM